MHRYQKTAWVRLIILTLAWLIIGVAWVAISSDHKANPYRYWVSFNGENIRIQKSALDKALEYRCYPLLGFGGCAMMAIGVIEVIMRYKKRSHASFDERDIFLEKKASLVAWLSFFWFFAIVCTALFIVIYTNKNVAQTLVSATPIPETHTLSTNVLLPLIPVIVLPAMLVLGGNIFLVAHSITILIQYGRGSKNAEE